MQGKLARIAGTFACLAACGASAGDLEPVALEITSQTLRADTGSCGDPSASTSATRPDLSFLESISYQLEFIPDSASSPILLERRRTYMRLVSLSGMER